MEATTLPRLLASEVRKPLTLDEHERVYAPTRPGGNLLNELARAGIIGRGGAGFPTHQKIAFLRAQNARAKFVVVNAMEGEPASHKDRSLLAANPHLVLDGAEALAGAVGANRIAVCVAREYQTTVNHVSRAIHERSRRRSRGPALDLHTPPGRYAAGEESALVHWLNDHECLPQYRPVKPAVLRIGSSPVLLDNAETCANVGLVARYGADWYRALGTPEHAGTALVSVTGAVTHPTVLEVALGTPLRSILRAAGADTNPQAVLLGGYSGTWLLERYLDTPYDNESLKPLGARTGAGVLMVLPASGCALSEAHNIVKWMANESARQCGPCAFGLPALADDVAQLVVGTRDPEQTLRRLHERANQIAGRGACHHPDGVINFVRSTLSTFDHDVREHAHGRPCAGAKAQRYAPVPRVLREEELVWE